MSGDVGGRRPQVRGGLSDDVPPSMRSARTAAPPADAGVMRRFGRLPSPKPLRRLLPLVRPYAPRLALALICLLIGAGVGLAFPRVAGILIDAAFKQRDRHLLDRIALGLIALFALQGAMNFVQVYVLTSTTERIIARLREQLFARLIRLSPAFFTDQRTGELTSRLSADLAVLQTLCNTYVSEFTRQSILLVGGVVMLTLTNPQLAATTLAVAPLVVAAAFIFGRALRRASTGVQDRVAEAMGTANEAFSQIRTVQGFVREETETRRYAAHLRDVVTAAIHRAVLRGLFFGLVGFIAFAGIVVILRQGALLVLAGGLTQGEFTGFLLYAVLVAGAIGSLTSLFGGYQEAVGAAHRVFELLEQEPTVAEPRFPVPSPRPVRGAVAFEHVTFRYGPTLPDVLEDVSLTIGAGEVVALVGPSGAGKTTIASLLPRFWDVTDRARDARRSQCADAVVRRPARLDRHRAAGTGLVQRYGARQHRLRPSGRQ